MFLENRSILFFSAQAFGYQNEIRAEMERMGARVDYFDERPANSFAVKAAIRINRNLLARYIDRYHARIIERTKNRKYDYVFFIKGESISVENLDKIKELHPEAKLIIYHWDSIANNRNALRILPVFDRAFSFDKPDCEKLGIRFLPLFYLRDYEEIGRQEPDYRYDLLFVGTVHSDRYGLLRRVNGQIERTGGRCFAYMFFQSRILYWKMKLQNKSLRGTSARDFRFAPLPKAGLLDLYRKSRAVIDIQHPRQTGLTMRCIETMGAKRKLITTNGHIAEYDFLRPEQHSDRRPAESRRAARFHDLSLPGHTCRDVRPLSDRPLARNDSQIIAPVGSDISTKDEFSAREGLSAFADSPSRLSETIFHRAQGLGNPFRYHNSTEYFPPFENGRFYRTQRDSDRIPPRVSSGTLAQTAPTGKTE